MNNQRSVYNRLFSKEEKTELETHKVELNSIKDLEELNKKLIGLISRKAFFTESDFNTLESLKSNIQKAKNEYEGLKNNGEKLLNSARKNAEKENTRSLEVRKKVDETYNVIRETRKKAEDLGIKFNTLPIYKTLIKTIRDAEAYDDDVNNLSMQFLKQELAIKELLK